MINLKSPREIALMKEAGYILSDLFDYLESVIKPGVSTQTINDLAEAFVNSQGGIMAEKGYEGFPGAICASVNEVILHGIPSKSEILKNGDIISIDVVVAKNGYHADACRTYEVGEVSARAHKIVEAAKEAFYEGMKFAKPGNRLGDIQHAIEASVRRNGYYVPLNYTGHGIGEAMHEDPYIPNYGKPGTGVRLKEGMALAIEPMLLEFSNAVYTKSDNWTVVSARKGLTAHYENTIAITKEGYEILTKRKEEQ